MLDRVNQLIFGNTGASTDFGQIGSEAAGTVVRTKDLATIQALSEYQEGLATITSSADDPPNLEDINSLYLLITSQLAYIFQEGISEWHTDAEYFIGSFAKLNDKVYRSLTGTQGTPNTGNDPTTDTNNWEIYLLNRISGGTDGNLVSRNAAGEVADAGISLTGIYDRVYPIGCTYTQYPGKDSPVDLNLPGTWTNISSEFAGDFFRAEGGDALSFNGGEQSHAFQGHWHEEAVGPDDTNGNSGAVGSHYRAGRGGGTNINYSPSNQFNNVSVQDPISDGTNGTPQTASETRPVNYTIRIWERTA